MTPPKPDRSCYMCKERKPKTEFYSEPSRAGGLSNICKSCSTVKQRHYMQKLPPRQKLKYKLKYNYNMTLDEYDAILASQNGKCAICARVLIEPHIDHDHSCCPVRKKSCGKCIRAMLCGQCNTAAGLLGDNPETAISLANYLTKYQKAESFNVQD